MDLTIKQYDTVTGEVTGEITEKKSRFIATAFHVGNETEAACIIADMKKKYWDAKHNCYAYTVGIKDKIERFSDDGEPGGTAGRPILDVLKNRQLTDTLIVVTRYFGGVLLGTGGLVRAYTDSSNAALDNAMAEGKLITMCLMRKLSIKTDYNLSGKVKYLIDNNESVSMLDTEYTADVILTVAVPVSDVDGFTNKITDVTSGKAEITLGEIDYYPLTKQLA